jgi:hypothetical protein
MLRAFLKKPRHVMIKRARVAVGATVYALLGLIAVEHVKVDRVLA